VCMMDIDEALNLLGLSRNATPDQLKQAYRDLVYVWHPDRFGDKPSLREKAEEKLKQINAAYAMLREVIPTGALHPRPDPQPDPPTPRPPEAQSRPDPRAHPRNSDVPLRRASRPNFSLTVALMTCLIGLAWSIWVRSGAGNTRPDRSAVSAKPNSFLADLSTLTTGVFEGCQPEGSGGDPILNRLKSRDIPPSSYEPITVAKLLSVEHTSLDAAGNAFRANWPNASLAEAALWEQRGATLEGYLLDAMQQQPAAWNCNDVLRCDYQLWIGISPDADPSNAIIVGISPRLLPSHPNWRLGILNRLAKDRAKVRISGWLLWDQQYQEEVGKSRSTLWEIHPIHVIEVWSGGGWRNLDG
jgi:hypothetical protein